MNETKNNCTRRDSHNVSEEHMCESMPRSKNSNHIRDKVCLQGTRTKQDSDFHIALYCSSATLLPKISAELKVSNYRFTFRELEVICLALEDSTPVTHIRCNVFQIRGMESSRSSQKSARRQLQTLVCKLESFTSVASSVRIPLTIL